MIPMTDLDTTSLPTCTWETYTSTPARTQALAQRLGELLAVGDFLALRGELGGGKTCFVGGLAAGLRVSGRVSSPTFVLVHEHPGAVPLYHLDAYRLTSTAEIHDLGWDEFLNSGVVALEWAERARTLWPREYLSIDFHLAEEGRRLFFAAQGERPCRLLRELQAYGTR
jgi:tRNA threonylcarbamoyladenosine biosynthesis protein TsaE